MVRFPQSVAVADGLRHDNPHSKLPGNSDGIDVRVVGVTEPNPVSNSKPVEVANPPSCSNEVAPPFPFALNIGQFQQLADAVKKCDACRVWDVVRKRLSLGGTHEELQRIHPTIQNSKLQHDMDDGNGVCFEQPNPNSRVVDVEFKDATDADGRGQWDDVCIDHRVSHKSSTFRDRRLPADSN